MYSMRYKKNKMSDKAIPSMISPSQSRRLDTGMMACRIWTCANVYVSRDVQRVSCVVYEFVGPFGEDGDDDGDEEV
jgi:hypothetical protein